MDLELRHLRYVVTLAEELHFTRAAARLGLAQSALSAQLRRLEKHLDIRLFERSSRVVTLTPAGEEFVARARTMLRQAADIERSLRSRSLDPDLPRTLRIVADPAFPEVAGALSARHPDIEVTVRREAGEAGVKAVTSGDADLCQAWEPGPATTTLPPGVAQATLVEEPLWAILPTGHVLARLELLPLGRLQSESWVGSPPGTRRSAHLTGVCRAAGFTPQVRYVVDHPADARSLVAVGSCVDLAPPRSLAPSGCVAVPLAEDIRGRAFVVWRRSSVPDWLVREVLEDAREAFLRELAEDAPAYRALVASQPSRFAALTDPDPVGWPPRRGRCGRSDGRPGPALLAS
jgi:DNA-binding transcriptional LysR family regulator